MIISREEKKKSPQKVIQSNQILLMIFVVVVANVDICNYYLYHFSQNYINPYLLKLMIIGFIYFYLYRMIKTTENINNND